MHAQARQIIAAGNADAFSTLVSLILIVSSTLRIAFWVGARYETVVLIQAFATVITQLLMLRVVTRVNEAKRTAGAAASSRRVLYCICSADIALQLHAYVCRAAAHTGRPGSARLLGVG
jgi:hypothetical protein